MKRFCVWLTRLYPRDWTARYGSEYVAMLESIPSPGVRDAADVLAHLGWAWVRTAWRSPFGPALVLAAVVLVAGAVNAGFAMRGGRALWIGVGLYTILALLSIPAASIAGYLTARRSGNSWIGAAGGAGFVAAGLLPPALLLFAAAAHLASGAEPFPVDQFTPLAKVDDPAVNDRLMNAAMNSRETLWHWGRTAIAVFGAAAAAGTLASGFGGLVHAAVRRVRS